MSHPFAPGDLVQTPFGKGLLRELRNNGRVAVDVRGRSMIFDEREISPADDRRRRPRASDTDARVQDGPAGPSDRATGPAEVDLHGLTVEQALSRAGVALNDALLADRPELRFIHGRSSTRIRDALHRWLGGIASVRGFRVDPRNEGVTIVRF